MKLGACKLLAALVLLAAVSPATAQQASREEHLRLAARHLSAAGLPAEAQRFAGGAPILPPASDQVFFEVEMLELDRTALDKQEPAPDLDALITASKNPEVESVAGEAFTFVTAPPGQALALLLGQLKEQGVLASVQMLRLSTAYGRPAACHAGGEFPMLVPAANGSASPQFKSYGPHVDVIPTRLDGDRLHAKFRVSLSQIDDTRSVEINEIVVPGLRVREFETACDLTFDVPLVIFGQLESREKVTKNRLGIKTTEEVEIQPVMVLTAHRGVLQAVAPQKHVRMAAGHLDAAGLPNEAQRLRGPVPPAATAAPPEQLVFKVQVLEVSLTKLRSMGLEIGPDEIREVVPGGDAADRPVRRADVLMDSLIQNSMAKQLAAPQIATFMGRPATIDVGGEIALPVVQPAAGAEPKSIPYGLHVDIVPTPLDAEHVRAGIHIRVSELENGRTLDVGGVTVPGLRVRETAGAYDLEYDRPCIIRGVVLKRMEARRTGFRKVKTETNEIETIAIVTMSRVTE